MKVGVTIAVVLALTLVFVLGVLTGEHWGGINRVQEWQRQQQSARQMWSDSARRARDTAEAREYAEAMARIAQRIKSVPREVRRVQLYEHCAVSFVIRDSLRDNNVFLGATAYSPPPSLLEIGKAWTYKAGGFAPGDTATVVFQNARCSQLATLGLFGGLVPRALELHVVQ